MGKFTRNSLARLLSQCAGKVALLGWITLLARALNPEGFGAYVYLFTVVGLLSIFSDYGLGYLTTRRVAQNPAESGRYLTHTQLLRGGLAAVAYLLLVAVAVTTQSFRGMTAAALVFGFSIFTVSAINGFNAILNAREELQWSSLMNALLPVATLVIGLGFLRAGWGLLGAVIPTVIAGVVVVGAEFALFREKHIEFDRRVEHRFLFDLARQGLPFFTMSILATLNVSLDTVLLKMFQGDAAVAMYNVSYKLILALMILPAALGDAAFPIWSRDSSPLGQGHRLPLTKVLGFLFGVGLALSMTLTLAASPLVRMIFGEAYAAAVPVLRIHSWTLLLMYLNSPFAYRLIASNRMREVNVTFFWVVLLNGLVNLMLIPRYSYLGAAMTTVISESVNFALLLYWIRRAEKPEPRRAPAAMESARYDLPAEHFVGNPGASQWKIIEWVPLGSKVLDIGCASGEVARYLVEKRSCRVVGVEKDPWLAAKARPYCEHVYVGDVETDDILRQIAGPFEVIVLADLLEHLRQPEKVLRAVRPLLCPEGYVLASIPNVANWRIRLKLLAGRFDYTETGLLDRTHLRFFTRRTARELFHQCGFRIAKMTTTAGQGRSIPTLLAGVAPGLFAYQFIFRAVPRRPNGVGDHRQL